MWLQTNCCVVSWWLDSCYVLFSEHSLCKDRNEGKVVDLRAAEHLQTFLSNSLVCTLKLHKRTHISALVYV